MVVLDRVALERIVIDRGSAKTRLVEAWLRPGDTFIASEPIRGRYRVTRWRGRKIAYRVWVDG